MTAFTPGTMREIPDPEAEMSRLAGERQDGAWPWVVALDRAEAALALDAVMVFYKTIEARHPDDGRLPALQALQDRLAGQALR